MTAEDPVEMVLAADAPDSAVLATITTPKAPVVSKLGSTSATGDNDNGDNDVEQTVEEIETVKADSDSAEVAAAAATLSRLAIEGEVDEDEASIIANPQLSTFEKRIRITRRLLRAASSGATKSVRDILNVARGEYIDINGFDAGEDDESRTTPLIYAASFGYDEIARLLLEAGADVNTSDAHGWTALMWASNNNHHAAVRLLLEHGADSSKRTATGRTVLDIINHSAAADRHRLSLTASPADLAAAATAMLSGSREHTGHDSLEHLRLLELLVGNGVLKSGNTTNNNRDSFISYTSGQLRSPRSNSSFSPAMPMGLGITTSITQHLLGDSHQQQLHLRNGDALGLLQNSSAMSSSSIGGDSPDLEAADPDFNWSSCEPDQMFVLSPADLPRILNAIVTDINPNLRLRDKGEEKYIPANLLFLGARFAFHYTSHEFMHQLLEQAMVEINKSIREHNNDQGLLTFWMANQVLLLYYLKRDKTMISATADSQVQLIELIHSTYRLLVKSAQTSINRVLNRSLINHDALPELLMDVKFQPSAASLDKMKREKRKSLFFFGNNNHNNNNHNNSEAGSIDAAIANAAVMMEGGSRNSSIVPAAAPLSPDSWNSQNADTVSSPHSPRNFFGFMSSRPSIVGNSLNGTLSKHQQQQQQQQQNQSSKPQSLQPNKIGIKLLTMEIESTLSILKSCDIHKSMVNSVISHLFYYISAQSFNQIITSNELCCRSRAVQIRMNITQLEDWIRVRSLPTAITLQHLEPLIQLLQLLQCISSIKDTQSLLDVLDRFDRINPLHVRSILDNYRYETDEERIPNEVVEFMKAIAEEVEERQRRLKSISTAPNTASLIPKTPLTSTINSSGIPITPATSLTGDTPTVLIGEPSSGRIAERRSNDIHRAMGHATAAILAAQSTHTRQYSLPIVASSATEMIPHLQLTTAANGNIPSNVVSAAAEMLYSSSAASTPRASVMSTTQYQLHHQTSRPISLAATVNPSISMLTRRASVQIHKTQPSITSNVHSILNSTDPIVAATSGSRTSGSSGGGGGGGSGGANGGNNSGSGPSIILAPSHARRVARELSAVSLSPDPQTVQQIKVQHQRQQSVSVYPDGYTLPSAAYATSLDAVMLRFTARLGTPAEDMSRKLDVDTILPPPVPGPRELLAFWRAEGICAGRTSESTGIKSPASSVASSSYPSSEHSGGRARPLVTGIVPAIPEEFLAQLNSEPPSPYVDPIP